MATGGVVFAATVCFVYSRAAQLKPSSVTPTIIYPTLLEARAAGKELTIILSDDFILNLKRSSVFAKDVLRVSSDEGNTLEEYLDGEELNRNIYHDKSQLSAVSVALEDGVRIEGIIKGDLRIKPRLEEARDAAGRIPHDLYQGHGSYSAIDSKSLTKSKSNTESRTRSSNVASVNAEMAVLVSSSHKNYFKTHDNLTTYIGVTVAAVNVLFSAITRPTILIRICLLEILSVQQEAQIYETVKGGNTDYINAKPSLNRLKDFVRSRSYEADVVYLFTSSELIDFENGQWDTNVRGMAYTGTPCTEHRVAIVEDAGYGFESFYYTTHELGHTLGCMHDGDPVLEKLPQSLKSQICPANAGFIMGSHEGSPNRYNFSNCCINIMKEITRMTDHKCLLTKNCKHYLPPSKKLPREGQTQNETCKHCRKLIDTAWYFDVTTPKDTFASCKVKCLTVPVKIGNQIRTNICTTTIKNGALCYNEKICWNDKCVQRPHVPE